MTDKEIDKPTGVLVGYNRPFQDDLKFRDAMRACNKVQNFIPLMGRGIYSKEKAEELNEIVKKRRKK